MASPGSRSRPVPLDDGVRALPCGAGSMGAPDRTLRAIQSSLEKKCYKSAVRPVLPSSLRPSVIAVAVLALLLAAFGWALLEAHSMRQPPARRAAASLTRELGLTDLVLVTEARYLRHLALADRNSAFQDHPLALEHFPSGAAIGVPAHLRGPDVAGGRP